MFRTLSTLAVLAAVACDDSRSRSNDASPTAPAEVDGQVGLKVRADRDAAREGVYDQDMALFSLTTAVAHVDEIDLYLPLGTTCADLDPVSAPVSCGFDKLVVRGPFEIDLLTGASTPDLGLVGIPALVYTRVDVELAPGPAGWTLSVGGLRDDGATPWAAALAFDEEARFDGLADFSASDAGSVLLLLDPSDWFVGAPVEACLDSGDLVVENGVIDLDEARGACDDFADAFEDAVEDSGRLARDGDDDGVEDEVEHETETEHTETENETETETEND